MQKRSLVTISLLLVHLFPSSLISAQEGGEHAAAEWLEAQQQVDGGFSNGFADESDIGTTADAAIALAFLGRNPQELISGGSSPLDFLARSIPEIKVLGPGVAAKVALAVHAVGLNPRNFANTDLVALVSGGFNPEIGMFGLGPFESGLAIRALVALNEDVPEGAIEGLIATRFDDGSYAFGLDPDQATGDSNTTAIVVQALLGMDAGDQIAHSLTYFRNTQNDDHGWTFQKPSEFGEETDSNSTALVIQALLFAGEDLDTWGDPIATLRDLQEPSGAFAFSVSFPGENILATLQSLLMFSGGNTPAAVSAEHVDSSKLAAIVLSVVIAVLGAAVLFSRMSEKI